MLSFILIIFHAHGKWQQWSLGKHTCHNIQRQSHIHTQNSKCADCLCTQSTQLCLGRVHFTFFGIEARFTPILQKEKQSKSVLYHPLSPECAHTTQSPLPPTLLHKQRSLCKGLGKPIFFIPCLPLCMVRPPTTHASDHHLIAGASWSTNWILIVSPK